MKTIEEIMEQSVADSKVRADESRATTIRLGELNALLIHEESSRRADKTRKASDAILDDILEKASGKRTA